MLDDEMVGKVAMSMRAQHAELSHGTKRAPHFHWTRCCHVTNFWLSTDLWLLGSLQLDKMLAQGAVGKLWSGTVSGVIKAVKEIRCASSVPDMCRRVVAQWQCGRCDDLDEETVRTVAAEVEVSWLLAQDCPRNLIVR